MELERGSGTVVIQRIATCGECGNDQWTVVQLSNRAGVFLYCEECGGMYWKGEEWIERDNQGAKGAISNGDRSGRGRGCL